MTVLDHRLAAAVTRPRPAPEVAPSASDLQLIAEFNRLLDAATMSESTAEEALDNLAGSLLATMKPGVESLSKDELLALVKRAANRLGCPPAPAPAGLFARLVRALGFRRGGGLS